MKRTTVFLDEGAEHDLRALARRQNVTLAEVVRDALDQYVARSKKGPARRPGFVAVGASGEGDVAERHEELLWQGREPHRDARPGMAGVRSSLRARGRRRKRTR